MSESPSYGERPPLQGGFRRSFTLPARQLSVHEKAGLDKADANADILYTHPSARIISFSPPTESIKSTSKAEIPPETDYPVDTVETLPWRSRTETLAATGVMVIEKVRGSTNFLKCQDIMHAILRNSQCWCVDGESKFVLRVRKFQYYRIELPAATQENKSKVEELKKVLPTVLRYERTPCPFVRAFTVDLPDDAITPRRKGQWKRRDSSQPNTPEIETPSLRRTQPTRNWSLRTPPTSYPKNGPGSGPDDERGRSGNLSATSSLRAAYNSTDYDSPTRYASDQEGTDSDNHISAHESEGENMTDRSGTSSPRRDLVDLPTTVQAVPVAAFKDSIVLPKRTAIKYQSTNAGQRDVENVINFEDLPVVQHNISHTAVAETHSVDRQNMPQNIDSREEDSDEIIRPGKRDIADSPPALVELSNNASTANTTEDSYSTSLPKEVVPQHSYSNLGSSGIHTETSVSIEVSPDVENVSQDIPSTMGPESDSGEEDSFKNGSNADAQIIRQSFDPKTSMSSATDRSKAPPLLSAKLEKPHHLPENLGIEMSGLDNSSEIDTPPPPDTDTSTTQSADEDSRSSRESVRELDTTQEGHRQTHVVHDLQPATQASIVNDVAAVGAHTGISQDLDDGSDLEDDEDDEDNLSTVSSVDSFHTISSPINEFSQAIDTSDVQQFNPRSEGRSIDKAFAHKRELSEMTVTASTTSDPASPDRTLLSEHFNDSEQFPMVQRSYLAERSDSEPIASSSAISGPDPVRQRLKSRRSFSPMPPASTLFNGDHIRHDSGRGHMTKVILQKIIVKPIELAILIAHILGRIAGGATVSDLLSGDLFKKPNHSRRVSGFADQLHGGRSASDTEDDYGVPVRGRRRSVERRAAMLIDDKNQNGSEDVD